MIMQPPVFKKEDKKLVHMKLYVRYMVSLRCKMIVKEELEKLELQYIFSPQGGIEFLDKITQKDLNTLKTNLQKSGLDLLDVYESKLIERIIDTITEVIHSFNELPNLSYEEIIAIDLNEANESVLKIFSEVVGMSVVQFIVIQKVERIKELLLYNEVPLSEITTILRYKSEQHLIAQFKKVTGLSPSFFKQLKQKRLDNLKEL